MDYISIALFKSLKTPKRFTMKFSLTHSLTHSHTDSGVDHARRLPAYREQLRVQCLAQGHFDNELGVAGNRTCDLRVARRPLYP